MVSIDTRGDARDHRVIVRLLEENNRHPRLAGNVTFWVDDAMQGRNPAIIGPLSHQVTDVDDEAVLDLRNLFPGTVSRAHSQAAR